MVKYLNSKIKYVDGEKFIKRLLFGKQILVKYKDQNNFVRKYIDTNREWSTLTSSGEAYPGDILKFKDGYIAKIVSFRTTRIIEDITLKSVIIVGLDDNQRSEIPLNGRASWECVIEKLEFQV